MSVFDLLRGCKDFTDTDRAIAAYVLDHPDIAAKMNIGDLSRETHTSNAAVTRLCHKLGLEGYRTFRVELARESERARMHVFDVNPDLPFMEGSSTEEMMESILNLSLQALEETRRTVTAQAVQKAAELICDARRVAIYAIGDTFVSTQGFSNLLMKVDVPCIEGVRHGDNYVTGNMLGPSDVALLVTYSGMLLSLIAGPIADLRSRGCKVVLITAHESPEEYVDGIECVVALPKRETRKGRIATYYSQACIRYALNCIYGEIFMRTWQRSKASQERSANADLWDE